MLGVATVVTLSPSSFRARGHFGLEAHREVWLRSRLPRMSQTCLLVSITWVGRPGAAQNPSTEAPTVPEGVGEPEPQCSLRPPSKVGIDNIIHRPSKMINLQISRLQIDGIVSTTCGCSQA